MRVTNFSVEFDAISTFYECSNELTLSASGVAPGEIFNCWLSITMCLKEYSKNLLDFNRSIE